MSNEILHRSCGGVTTLSDEDAEALRQKPIPFDALICAKHDDFFLVKEFSWKDTSTPLAKGD